MWVVLTLASCSHKGPPADKAAALALATPGAGTDAPDSIEINPRLLHRFSPLVDIKTLHPPVLTTAKVNLGRQLFYDTRLSKEKNLSCNSCHSLAGYGVDGKATSTGFNGKAGSRNAPTVYNAAGHFAQFWDGRAANVEEQAKGPLLNPREMAMSSADEVTAVLKSVPAYVSQFRQAFPDDADPITLDNVGRCIGAFERGLVTPGRWDQYLRGDTAALN